jgi:hypothetical protein
MSSLSPDKAPCPACGAYGYQTSSGGAGLACKECGADIPNLDWDDAEERLRQMENTPCGHGWLNMTKALVPYVCTLCDGRGLLPANLHHIKRDPFDLFIQLSLDGGFQRRWSPDMRDPDNKIQESPQFKRLLRY